MRTLKIKKVDDKPMVIHTKEKAKIHSHELKGARIKDFLDSNAISESPMLLLKRSRAIFILQGEQVQWRQVW